MDTIAWITIPVTVCATILTIFFKINSSNVKKICRETHDRMDSQIRNISTKTEELRLLNFKIDAAEKKIDEMGKILEKMSLQLNDIKLSLASRKKWK